jgi:hypothetical protein
LHAVPEAMAAGERRHIPTLSPVPKPWEAGTARVVSTEPATIGAGTPNATFPDQGAERDERGPADE